MYRFPIDFCVLRVITSYKTYVLNEGDAVPIEQSTPRDEEIGGYRYKIWKKHDK